MSSEILTFEKTFSESGTTLVLKGAIDERSELDGLFSDLRGPCVTVVMRGVTRVNSSGVRYWINALRQLPAFLDVEFIECSRVIVNQLNMITNFFPPGAIRSFYAPYYCSGCDTEVQKLIVIADHFQGNPAREAPEFSCAECGMPMSFQDDEERYFSFLRN